MDWASCQQFSRHAYQEDALALRLDMPYLDVARSAGSGSPAVVSALTERA